MHDWDLTALFANLDSFLSEKEVFLSAAEKIRRYKDSLGKSARNLKEGLDLYWELEGRLRRMESYAARRSDKDVRDSANKAIQGEVEQIRSRLAEMSSSFDPEIVAIPAEKMEQFFTGEPGLKVYERLIREILRKRRHILSPEEERILAAASDISGAGMSLHRIFTNADMPRETVALSDGSEIKLTDSNYVRHRSAPLKADRDRIAQGFFEQYGRFGRSVGEMLFAQLKVHRFYSEMRGYPSTLHAALDRDDIDVAIYKNLIDTVHRNLPVFHRYLRLKARALGLSTLEYQDTYAPFTRGMKIAVPYEEARDMLLGAFSVMGDEYLEVARRAFDEQWIDVFPTEGKKSGAYSDGWAYGVHPYVLMNYNGFFSDALTLAHELGHAVHSYFSNAAQPICNADYSIFVAEVASTFNENLLNDYRTRRVADEDERLYLLGNFLDDTIKGTFFRQVQFAEYEWMIHQRVEKGEALTDESLSSSYLDLVRRYYGHDEGVCRVPDFFKSEWAYIPHFYYNYYVFQYSTSVAAASALAGRVIAGEPGALEKYLGLLKAGASKDPVTILREAGADMTKPEAYEALMARAMTAMDELEKILALRGM